MFRQSPPFLALFFLCLSFAPVRISLRCPIAVIISVKDQKLMLLQGGRR